MADLAYLAKWARPGSGSIKASSETLRISTPAYRDARYLSEGAVGRGPRSHGAPRCSSRGQGRVESRRLNDWPVGVVRTNFAFIVGVTPPAHREVVRFDHTDRTETAVEDVLGGVADVAGEGIGLGRPGDVRVPDEGAARRLAEFAIERCFDVTEETLRAVFDALGDYRVTPEAMLLKPSMVIAGKYSPRQAGVDEVAEMTLACLRRTVPAAVPGIVFLSGGQEDITATRHLQAMNAIGGAPWELSFSYGRALQAPALAAWRGAAGNEDAAREVLLHRARCNSLARSGKYSDAAEEESRLAASC